MYSDNFYIFNLFVTNSDSFRFDLMCHLQLSYFSFKDKSIKVENVVDNVDIWID